jgi:glycosyltransferase involved in cell wall biosynthesis
MWFTKKKARVLTVGSIPPEWGGATDGGVAVVHAQLVSSFLRGESSVAIVGVIATNAPSITQNAPKSTKLMSPPQNIKDEKAWYFRVLDDIKPDCVVFFHIGHRWAKYHAESSVSMVGAIHSWNQITQTEEEKSLKAERLVSELLPRCDALVFPSRYTLEEGKILGFSYESPVYVAPNPLSEVFLKECITTGSRKERSVAAVGALKPIKRMDFVVRGSQACNADALIIGDGAEEQNLKDLASQLGWSERVVFHNRLPQRQIVDLLSTMGVFACPSTSESFGNVYIEALACGLPVIGFKGTFDEIEEKMGISIGLGLDGTASFEQFQEALDSVFSQRWERSILSSRVKEVFTPENTLAEYVSAIESAIV